MAASDNYSDPTCTDRLEGPLSQQPALELNEPAFPPYRRRKPNEGKARRMAVRFA